MGAIPCTACSLFLVREFNNSIQITTTQPELAPKATNITFDPSCLGSLSLNRMVLIEHGTLQNSTMLEMNCFLEQDKPWAAGWALLLV